MTASQHCQTSHHRRTKDSHLWPFCNNPGFPRLQAVGLQPISSALVHWHIRSARCNPLLGSTCHLSLFHTPFPPFTCNKCNYFLLQFILMLVKRLKWDYQGFSCPDSLIFPLPLGRSILSSDTVLPKLAVRLTILSASSPRPLWWRWPSFCC